jgi:hypothetical protein
MEKTPRRSAFVRRPREEDRFVVYLASRAGWVVLCTLITGWLAAAAVAAPTPLDSLSSTLPTGPSAGASANANMGSGGVIGGSDTYSDVSHWFVHNAMAVQVILGLIAQAATLLHRGQTINQLPTPHSHPAFYAAAVIIIIIQTLIVLSQAWFRGVLTCSIEGYPKTHIWILCLAMVLGPLGGLAVGVAVNAADMSWHVRHLKFLRLEFDTRLGMHSPR